MNKCGLGCGEERLLMHCWWECKIVQPLGKTWRFLKKTKNTTVVVVYLAIYPKTVTQKDTCTPMFSETLFIIAKI